MHSLSKKMLTTFASPLFRETFFNDPFADIFMEDDIENPLSWMISDDEETFDIKRIPFKKKSQTKRRKLQQKLQKNKKRKNNAVAKIDSHNQDIIGFFNNEPFDFGIEKIVNDKEKYQMVSAIPKDIQNIRVAVDETPEKEKYLTIEASDSKEKRNKNSYFKSSVSFKRQVLVPNEVKEKDLNFEFKNGKLIVDIPKSQESKPQVEENQQSLETRPNNAKESNHNAPQPKS